MSKKGIFRRWDCPKCGSKMYRRKPGACPKCGTERIKGPLCIQYTVRGERKTEACQKDSIKYAEALLGKRKQAKEGFVLPAKLKWGGLADEYKTVVSVKHADGGVRDGYSIDRLKEHFGKISLAEMRRVDLLDYINNRNKKVKEATVAKEVRLFKTIWNYALKSEYVSGNPWDGVTVSDGLPPIKDPITQAEEERLMASLPGSCRLLFEFMALTGARGLEARFITKKDVDLRGGIVYVKGKTRNGEVERQAIILDSDAKAVVKKAMKNKTGWLFPNPKTANPYANIKSTFKRAVERAGLKGKVKGPHDLRHLFVSRLIQAGTDSVTAATLSRHKDMRMLKRYSHLSANHLRDALEKSRTKKCK